MSRSPHKKVTNTYETLLREKDNFKVKVEFSASRIRVTMQHQNAKEAYTVFITQEDIDGSPILHLVYGSTESLFLDLTDNFGQVGISDDGVMVISIQLQLMGKVSTKTAKFYPVSEESVETTDIEGHLSSLASERNKYMSTFQSQHNNEISALRNESRAIKERMMKGVPNTHLQSSNPYQLQPPQPILSPQQQLPQQQQFPQQVSPPKPTHTQRKSPSTVLPISQERIIKSPTIIEQKDSSQTSACKCQIM